MCVHTLSLGSQSVNRERPLSFWFCCISNHSICFLQRLAHVAGMEPAPFQGLEMLCFKMSAVQVYTCLCTSILWLLHRFESLLGTIACVSLLVLALFNTYVICRYPQYRAALKELSDEDEKTIKRDYEFGKCFSTCTKPCRKDYCHQKKMSGGIKNKND